MSVSTQREGGTKGRAWTPGPWFYRASGDGFIIRSKSAQGPIAGVSGYRPIAEAEANARLLAASQELFEAASALIACDTAENWNALRAALSRAGEAGR